MLGSLFGFMLGSMYYVHVRMFVDIFIGKYVGMQPIPIPQIFLVLLRSQKMSFDHIKKIWTGSRGQ